MSEAARPVTQSEFFMWRTIFAIAHIDKRLSEEEIHLMAQVLDDIDFSPEQEQILKGDIDKPQDVTEMFKGISDPLDQARFFQFAREMIWADGDFAPQEQDIMMQLEQLHIHNVNVDALVGRIQLRFEGEDDDAPELPGGVNFSGPGPRIPPPGEMLHSFRNSFLRTRRK